MFYKKYEKYFAQQAKAIDYLGFYDNDDEIIGLLTKYLNSSNRDVVATTINTIGKINGKNSSLIIAKQLLKRETDEKELLIHKLLNGDIEKYTPVKDF